MNIKSSFFFIILFSISLQSQAQSCAEIFIIQEPATVDWAAVKAIKINIARPGDISMAQVREFSGPNSSLNLIIKSPFRHNNLGMSLLAGNIFYVLNKGQPINHSQSGQLMGNLAQFINVISRAKKGDWTAKKIIISTLLGIQPIARMVLNDPELDLLTEQGFLKLYGATDSTSLNVQISANAVDFTDDAFDTTRMEETTIRKEMKEIVLEVDGDALTVAMSSKGIIGATRYELYNEKVSTLIENLHLPKTREEYFLQILKEYDDTNWISSAGAVKRRQYEVLERLDIFIHAYVERFPREASNPLTKRLTAPWFLNAVKSSENFNRVYHINENRLTENLDLALSLNEQVSHLISDADLALTTEARLQFPHDNFQKDILEIKSEAEQLRVNDLTAEDLSGRISQLQLLQYRLSQTMDKVLVNVDNENVQNFSELNFTWSRVITNKSYEVQGRDYDHVVFEKNVTNYLKLETMWGDRCLGALYKGYVGTQNQAGLRAVTEIHKDLRYVKVMGRKLRLIGKLKGRTIYFFEVYDKDENFDQAWLRHLIENH